jgi:Asp-tRNA(Asn)/Glu-tRNA(Gln) amidotransferase A subunit family amidase
MKTAGRFADWTSLSQSDRAAAAEQCRSRLSGIGAKLHAVVSLLPSQPVGPGPLAGLPYAAKDLISTGVTPASWGCVSPLDDRGAPASVIERLTAAGGCLVATAEMTELAYEPSGINAGRGNVLNPWNFDFAPGGSSSGSAALVASGCCYAALGSDTGGSVRIPAHCCGVTGLKPTWGRIAVDGTMPLSPSLDTIGILARSAVDLALVWTALSGDAVPESKVAAAVTLEGAFAESDPEIGRLCRNAIEVLAGLGLAIAPRGAFPEDADRIALLVMQAEAARSHAVRLDDDRIDAILRRRLRKGVAIGEPELAAALANREAWRGEFVSTYLGDAAVALLPVMPIRTPRYRDVDPSMPEFKARTLYALSRFTRFVNYLGLPALAVPAGFDSRGMPVGLQMIGRPGSEALLLDLGRRFQAATDWHGRVPEAVALDIATEKGVAA